MKALDFLFPRYCSICGSRLLSSEKDVCSSCLADAPLTYFWSLPRNPMSDKINAQIQEYLMSLPSREGFPMKRPELYCNACALLFYRPESEYRSIPMQIKYFANLSVAQTFGSMLGTKLGVCPWFASVDMIIPVPLHWSRKLRRGYNQAELIARAVAMTASVSDEESQHKRRRDPRRMLRTDILYRKRRTKTQTKLNAAQKRLNVANAFGVRPETVAQLAAAPHHILLIDDVFTTGATLTECYKALKPFVHPDTEFSFASIAYYE